MPRSAVKPASVERAPTEKRARTRQIVLRAATACIAEKGVAGATAAEIARRCELSWGVIQYHFGDRMGLFIALLENGFQSFTRVLSDLESTHPRPSDRIRALVEGTWALMTSDEYRVLLEVELQLGREAAHEAQVRKYVRETRRRLAEAWRKALAECPPERVDRASRLAVAALRGLALERALEGARYPKRAERDTVVSAVLDILGLQDG